MSRSRLVSRPSRHSAEAWLGLPGEVFLNGLLPAYESDDFRGPKLGQREHLGAMRDVAALASGESAENSSPEATFPSGGIGFGAMPLTESELFGDYPERDAGICREAAGPPSKRRTT